MTDIKKAFGIITDKLNETLKGQNFTQQKVESSNQNEIVNLFTSETVAYSVIYYKDKMMVLGFERRLINEKKVIYKEDKKELIIKAVPEELAKQILNQ